MNKEQVYQYLKDQGIQYEVKEHEAIFDMEALAKLDLPYPEADAKNLFLRDDKKRNYYLVTVKGDQRVDLKKFRHDHDLRPLSFASEKSLKRLLGLKPGSVTPLGLLNDEQNRVHFYLDAQFAGQKVAVHPNENTATVWLQSDDLMQLIKQNGNVAEYTEI